MSNELESRAIAETDTFTEVVTGVRTRVTLDDDDVKTSEVIFEAEPVDEHDDNLDPVTIEPVSVQRSRSAPPPAPPSRRPSTTSSVPPRPPLAAWRASSRAAVPQPAAPERARIATPIPDLPGDVHAQLSYARSELARVASQMRARDAYLRELENALETATRQLATWGLGTADGAARLVGRLRGQAFRIAELEASLQETCAELAKLQDESSPRKPVSASDDLQAIRGIGPRFETQLRTIGIASYERIAALSGDDIQRIALLLRIRPERIARDGWVEQARAMLVGQARASEPASE
jgi:NADH-quinone oxidoreductase subunit E